MGMHIRDSAAICQLIEADQEMVAIIGAVAELRLPDGWIAAGFVRNRVWDVLHDYAQPTPLADIDVIYFDPVDRTKAAEKAIEAALHSSLPGRPWSVKNQARMAERNGDPPYRSTLDALGYWCETPTAVAVRLDVDGQLELAAPLGIDDLLDLIVRPTPYARAHPRKLAVYRARMAEKSWPTLWPRLTVLDL